jgi:hypothetical protein
MTRDDEFYIRALEDQVKWLGEELEGAQRNYDHLREKYERLLSGEDPNISPEDLYCCRFY